MSVLDKSFDGMNPSDIVDRLFAKADANTIVANAEAHARLAMLQLSAVVSELYAYEEHGDDALQLILKHTAGPAEKLEVAATLTAAIISARK